jgi:hypothetical protein
MYEHLPGFVERRLRTDSRADTFLGTTMSGNQTFPFEEIPQVRGWEMTRFNGIPVIALETADGTKHPFRFTEEPSFEELADEILRFERA